MWAIGDGKVYVDLPSEGVQEPTTAEQPRHRRIYFDAVQGLAVVLQHRITKGEITVEDANTRMQYFRNVVEAVYEKAPPEVQDFVPGPLDIGE